MTIVKQWWWVVALLACAGIGAAVVLREQVPLAREQAAGVDVQETVTELEAEIAEIGIRGVMEKLVAESEGGSAFDCHQRAHEIGRIGYRLEREGAFSSCDASCHSGCYHGAMEGLLHEKGSKNLVADVGAVCDIFNTRFGLFECFHGVGHGLLAYEGYDLPKTITECERFGAERGPFCLSGVFMENIVAAQGLGAAKNAHETEWVNQTDPHFPCNAVSQDSSVQYTCYQMQTGWMLTMFNYDFDRVADECLHAPDAMIPICFQSFGRDIAGHVLRDSEKMRDMCMKAPDAYQNDCNSGAVQVVIDFWGPKLAGQASEFCAKLPANAKAYCYSVVARRLDDVFPIQSGVASPERQAVCNSFEADYRSMCSS